MSKETEISPEPERFPNNTVKTPRKIRVLSDIDGTIVSAPEPIKAAIGLYSYNGDINRDFKLPPQGTLTEGNPKSNTVRAISKAFHVIRPVKAGTLKGLEMFRSVGLEHGREIEIFGLTGRTSENHEQTRNLFKRPKFSRVFSGLHLNPNKNAHSFKEHVGRQSVNEGTFTVLFENDIRAALAFARIGTEDVLVYLFKNWTNNIFLLARAAKKGFKLSENIVLVKNTREAVKDLKKRLSEGKI